MKFKCFCLFCTFFLWAIDASSVNVLKVWKIDGQTETFYLPQKPRLTLSNQTAFLHIDNLVFEYPLSSYLKMTFEDSGQTTSIQDINASKLFQEKNSKISDDSPYVVYNINGSVIKRVSNSAKEQTGHFNLPTGIYVVKSNHTSFKIIVK